MEKNETFLRKSSEHCEEAKKKEEDAITAIKKVLMEQAEVFSELSSKELEIKNASVQKGSKFLSNRDAVPGVAYERYEKIKNYILGEISMWEDFSNGKTSLFNFKTTLTSPCSNSLSKKNYK